MDQPTPVSPSGNGGPGCLDVERIAADARCSVDLRADAEAVVVVLLAGLPREVAMVVDDGTTPDQELAGTLGPVLDQIGVPRVALVVPRPEGATQPRDVRLLAAFRAAVRRVDVVDLVVVGEHAATRLGGRAVAV